jgi:feruloyl-CoA synthase
MTTVQQTLFARPDIAMEQLADGAAILRSRTPLRPYAKRAGDWLVHWARVAPDRLFLAERPGGDTGKPWTPVTYAQALERVEALATWMIGARLSAERPLAILSDNGVDHALLALAAMHMGAPCAPISQAYSLLSKDHAKLRAIIGLITPGAVFAPSLAAFGPAIEAIADLHDGAIIVGDNDMRGMANAVALAEVGARRDSDAVSRAIMATGPDTIAKFLFTSGSTGEPKGVINTQRMLCASQESKAQIWPFIETTPPVILDWLPWSHTFGGNHNFNMVLRNGGTLFIDGGKPAPGAFGRTLSNLRDTSSTIHFNVPRGLDLLVEELRKDDALARHVLSSLRVIFYAGAALPQHIWGALLTMSRDIAGHPVALVSSWGSTETAPLASDCHFQADRAGNIGVPAPGVELKLVPNAGKKEIRVRSPFVMPGYWKRDDLTRKAFDEDGFYMIGDAVRLADPSDPNKGLFFDGRVAEDFKLMSGTWVSVGALRVKAIEMLAPIASDVVIPGHDEEEIGLLVFANVSACRALAGLPEDAPARTALDHSDVIARVREGLRAMKALGGGSSTYATRALLMDEPPSVDAGEITDKGYVNQRTVLARRAGQARALRRGDAGTIGL